MKKKKKKLFDIINMPLNNICLIESSAGTGKTFTISLLYLRILLGINTIPYSINNILVVTFTQSAKKELINRITKYIQDLKIACIKKNIHELSVLKKIFYEIKNFRTAYNILQTSEYNIHQACIYTIDAFFKKILNWNTFASETHCQNNIVEDEKKFYLQSTIIYWRKYYYSIPIETTCIIYKNWKNPQALLIKIYPFIQNSFKKNKIINTNIKIIYQYCTIFTKLLKKIKKNWFSETEKIIKIIIQFKLNKRIYNTTNIFRWITTISKWVQQSNCINQYDIPHVLKYFTQSKLIKYSKKKTIDTYQIFQDIELLFKNLLHIQTLLLHHAILNVLKIFHNLKKKEKILNFDDILIKLNKYIKKYSLDKIILQKYPIAFIDEFQDTNTQQCKIFLKIYKKSHGSLILIGDPKQSIYSFRGVNILNYLKIKSIVHSYYSLNVNWRSSTNINQGINILFNRLKHPFIIKGINFIPTYSPLQNKKIEFIVNKINYPAFKIIYQNKQQTIQEYQDWISEKCAKNISHWLQSAHKQHATIKINNHVKILSMKDIVILVRNKTESEIIKNKLENLNIPTIYLSNKKNIYHSKEAYELLCILQAVININNINYLKQACFTNLLKKTALEIFQLDKNHSYLSLVIKEFQNYYHIWKYYGIYNLIQDILSKYIKISCITDNININNIIYIGELIQQESEKYSNKKELIIWLKKKISGLIQPSNNDIIQQQNNDKYIKIISMHQSKGLEFPIIWIPFGISQLHNNNNNHLTQSEEMRLLYVACTRPIIHCSIGISTLKTTNNKKNNYTNLQNSPLGYIIQRGKILNCEQFNHEIQKINHKNIIEIHNTVNTSKLFKNKNKKYKKNYIHHRYKTIPIKLYHGENTSFSKLQNSLNYNQKCTNTMSQNERNVFNVQKTNKMNVHTFPKGKKIGIFLHKILYKINFQKKINTDWLYEQLNLEGISKKWIKMLIVWCKNILNLPLQSDGLTLSKIHSFQCIKELKFLIPIKKYITNIQLSNIRKYYDTTIPEYTNIEFNKITGMLNGVIDLVFIWKEKYYLLDYKSNWLGKNNDYYTKTNIKNEIIKKNYDLQYQIYTLALDRYLKTKIKNYSFNQHFGGIFYIFLRSIEKNAKNIGIFFNLPQQNFIEKFNNLFN